MQASPQHDCQGWCTRGEVRQSILTLLRERPRAHASEVATSAGATVWGVAQVRSVARRLGCLPPPRCACGAITAQGGRCEECTRKSEARRQARRVRLRKPAPTHCARCSAEIPVELRRSNRRYCKDRCRWSTAQTKLRAQSAPARAQARCSHCKKPIPGRFVRLGSAFAYCNTACRQAARWAREALRSPRLLVVTRCTRCGRRIPVLASNAARRARCPHRRGCRPPAALPKAPFLYVLPGPRTHPIGWSFFTASSAAAATPRR